MVKPDQIKDIGSVEVTASETRFKIVLPFKDRKVIISFDINDAHALRKELDEWIDIGTVVKATKRLVKGQ